MSKINRSRFFPSRLPNGRRHRLKAFAERLLNLRIYLKVPHGCDELEDIARLGGQVNLILDVGANVGQSAQRYRAAFPEAEIHSFEPVSETFHRLVRNTNGLRVNCHQLAMGAAVGTAMMHLTDNSLTSSLRPESESTETESVKMTTIDNFVDTHQLEEIDLLKVDTEGFDIQVLEGAQETLASGKVRFLLVEVGFHRGDHRHPLFDDVRDLLVPHGFQVFGLYHQTTEWNGRNALRFADAAFARTSK